MERPGWHEWHRNENMIRIVCGNECGVEDIGRVDLAISGDQFFEFVNLAGDGERGGREKEEERRRKMKELKKG